MDVQSIVAANVLTQLADRFQKRQALDVADRSTDFDGYDIHTLRDGADAVLDLVRDVRDDLDRSSQVVAATLFLNDGQIDLACRPVVAPGRRLIREALVVPQVQVRLRTVVGHVDLAVLVRAHGPGVDVDVRVELLKGDFVAVPSSSAPIEAAASPLPSDETTPPVDRMYWTGRNGASGCVAQGVSMMRVRTGTGAVIRRRTRARSSGVSTPTVSSIVR